MTDAVSCASTVIHNTLYLLHFTILKYFSPFFVVPTTGNKKYQFFELIVHRLIRT